MILKTTTGELGNTKLSINNGIKGLFNGDFFKKQSILSDSDIKALQAYNAELDRVIGYEQQNGEVKAISVSKQTAFNRTMLEASDTAANLAENAGDAGVNLEQIPKVSKAGELALKGLSIAGNMFAMWVLSEGIKAFDNWIHRAERAKEVSEEFSSSFENMQKTHRDNTATIEELSDEYAELSENVDHFGNTTNLTSEQCERYHEITNQIAELMPDLVQGWDAEGNAILKVKGHLADLNEEYQKSKQNEAVDAYYKKDDDGNRVIDSVFDDYDNTVNGNFTSYENGSDGSDNPEKISITRQQAIDFLQKFGSGERKVIGDDGRAILEEADIDWIGQDTSDIQKQAIAYATKLKGEIEAEVTNIENAALNYAQSTDDYWKLGENSSYVSNILGNLSTDIIADNNLNTDEGIVKFVNNIINAIDSNKDGIKDAFNELFAIDLDTTDLSPEEVQDKVNTLVQQIADIIGVKDVDAFKISLGFDVDGLVTNYNNAINTASKNLKNGNKADLTKFFEDNSINTQEEIDKWNEIANSCNDATEAKKKYLEWKSSDSKPDTSTDKVSTQKAKIEELQKEYQDAMAKSNGSTDTSALDELSSKIDKAKSKLAELKSQEFTDAWASLENTDDDTLKNAKKDLTDLADAGKLTVDEFKCIPGVEDYFKNIGLSAEEAVKKINDLTDSTKQLSTLKSAIGSIQDAYSEKKENKVVGADTLSKMEAEFSSAGKAWDNYKQIAGSAKTSTADLKKAQDELATAYVNSSNFLSGLVDETGNCTEANKQYYISQLEELGIKNAEEVVNDAIIQQKADLAVQSFDLANATDSEIAELASENNTLNETSGALNNYIFYKALASNTALDTTDSIENLIALAEQCGATAEVINRLVSLLGKKQAYEQILASGNSDTQHALPGLEAEIDADTEWLKNNAKTNTKVKLNGGGVNVDPTKNGGTNKNSGSKSSSSKQEIDWIEIRLDRLADKTQKTIDKINNYIKQGTKNKLYKTLLKNIDAEIKANDKAAKKYSQKANSIKISKNKKTDKDLKKKVRNGSISGKYKTLIKEYGEKTANKIESYRTWYEKSQSAKNAARQKRLEKKEKQREALDSKISDYNNQLARKQTKANNYQHNLDLADTNGRPKSSKDYTNLIKNADKQTSNLKAQNKELVKYQKGLKKNSEEWYEIQQQIDDNKASMNDLTLSQVEWNNSIQEMKLDKFRNLSDLLSDIKSKFQALISLNDAQGYTESDADIAKEIKIGNNQIATNKGQINQQWDNILEDAMKKKSDKTGFGWGLSKKNANKFKSSYQNFLDGKIDQTQFEKELKSIGLTWNQVINNSELQDGIKNINSLEIENLNIMTEQEQKYDELAQKRIDAMNGYIDKLKEANDQKSKAIELEKLQQKLQAAKQNKSIMVYREGYGFNYEADQSAINEAQSALDDAQFDAFMDKLGKVVDLIQEGIDNGDFNLYDKNGNSLGDVDTLVKKYLSSISKELADTFSDLEFYEDKKGKIMVRQKGAAYANGVVNAPKGADSLVAETKPEILVRDGQWNLLEKTQFIDTKPGDIIIDGDKTEELLKKGYIESSGRAFNQGKGNYESYIRIKPWEAWENLPIIDRSKFDPFLFDFNSMRSQFDQMYCQAMDRQIRQLQAGLNMIQPKAVENNTNRIINIQKVELSGVNDVQTMMRELEDLATINSAAKQRAWSNK